MSKESNPLLRKLRQVGTGVALGVTALVGEAADNQVEAQSKSGIETGEGRRLDSLLVDIEEKGVVIKGKIRFQYDSSGNAGNKQVTLKSDQNLFVKGLNVPSSELQEAMSRGNRNAFNEKYWGPGVQGFSQTIFNLKLSSIILNHFKGKPEYKSQVSYLQSLLEAALEDIKNNNEGLNLDPLYQYLDFRK